ncbi:MAG: glycerate kinase [Candidatus Hydrogenedentota bacterium]
MRIIIAPDSFKECLRAPGVAEAIAAGWREVFPAAVIQCRPMADGGEGTVDALVAATGGRHITATVTGPRGTPVDATYGLLGGGETAVIEMAAASGLALLTEEERDPTLTSTRGTGELMAHALDNGARRLLVGIGGSATNDGGAGMAQALGFRLLDAGGNNLAPGGAALARLASIDTAQRHPALDTTTVEVACDVDNPLCGPTGASHVYGPQKGATPKQAALLDNALAHYADVVEPALGVAVRDVPGTGAAGGLGAGLMAFSNACLRSGVDLVADACGLAAAIAGADLVITGEGRLDRQSAYGKVPAGVARLANIAGVPCIALAGSLETGYETLYKNGLTAALSITPGPMPLADAMAHAPAHLRATAAAIARVWKAQGQAPPHGPDTSGRGAR